MHAREYITMQIVMRQLCDALDALNGYASTYRGISTAELLRGLTIHFVPNSNPDGVAISQFGLAGVKNPVLRAQVAAMSDGDLEQWKANANGVDLNRNFDADWYEFVGSPQPSPERYKGTFPGSEPEAAALIRLTQNYHIKRAISYHHLRRVDLLVLQAKRQRPCRVGEICKRNCRRYGLPSRRRLYRCRRGRL